MPPSCGKNTFISSHCTTLSAVYLLLSINIEPVESFHCRRVFDNLGHLYARADQLKDVAVILEWPRLMLGGVSHLEAIFEYGDELLDLTTV